MGESPYVLVNIDVNDPTLLSPTAKQISATLRSVFRRSAAARSSRRVNRYWCGRLAERAAELAAEVRRGEVRRLGQCRDVERLPVARIDEILRAEQMPFGRDGRHAASIPAAAFSPHI